MLFTKLFVVVQFSHLNIIVFQLLLISCWAQTIVLIVVSFNISSISCTVHRVLIHFNGCVHSLVLVGVVSFMVHSWCFSCTHTIHGILIHFHDFCNYFTCMCVELSYSGHTSACDRSSSSAIVIVCHCYTSVRMRKRGIR